MPNTRARLIPLTELVVYIPETVSGVYSFKQLYGGKDTTDIMPTSTCTERTIHPLTECTLTERQPNLLLRLNVIKLYPYPYRPKDPITPGATPCTTAKARSLSLEPLTLFGARGGMKRVRRVRSSDASHPRLCHLCVCRLQMQICGQRQYVGFGRTCHGDIFLLPPKTSQTGHGTGSQRRFSPTACLLYTSDAADE